MAKGQPTIGMTQDQVRNTSWGSTLSRHLTETRGHSYEQWVYDNGYASGYLYFTDGILTAIQR